MPISKPIYFNKSVDVANQFAIGYGSQRLVQPAVGSESWGVSFKRAERAVLDLKAEGLKAAQNLYSHYAEPICVFYSGGIDSEFMLHCFIESKTPFKVITCEFENDLNSHDLEYVTRFKNKFPQLDYVTYKLNIETFLSSAKANEYAELSKAGLPHLLSLMWLIDKVNAPIAIASGEPFFEPYQNQWCLKERESIASLYRFFYAKNKKGTPLFFQSNAEIFVSYLQDSIICDLTSGRRGAKLSSLTSKIEIYSRFFEMEVRPKFHGFEKLETLMNTMQFQLEQKHSAFLTTHYWPHKLLLEKLKYE